MTNPGRDNDRRMARRPIRYNPKPSPPRTHRCTDRSPTSNRRICRRASPATSGTECVRRNTEEFRYWARAEALARGAGYLADLSGNITWQRRMALG